MNFNYSRICSDLIEDLPPRTKEVILRRFGLERPTSSEYPARETLEAIGKSFGICRERVRQIEKDGFLRIESKLEKIQKIFQYFTQELQLFGNLKKEDILLSKLGSEKWDIKLNIIKSS